MGSVGASEGGLWASWRLPRGRSPPHRLHEEGASLPSPFLGGPQTWCQPCAGWRGTPRRRAVQTPLCLLPRCLWAGPAAPGHRQAPQWVRVGWALQAAAHVSQGACEGPPQVDLGSWGASQPWTPPSLLISFHFCQVRVLAPRGPPASLGSCEPQGGRSVRLGAEMGSESTQA